MNKDFMYFEKLIKNSGYKFTRQIQFVLKTLIESKIHLTAEDIYRIVKKDNVGLATVYRSLNKLKQLNIIKEININGINYYEMKIFSGNPLHIHFKCSKCNSIIDINNKLLNLEFLKLNSNIENEKNLSIFDTDILFTGICDKCKENEDGKTNKS